MDTQTIRKSVIAYKLTEDDVEPIEELTEKKIQQLCSSSVYSKAKKYERKHSTLFRTKSSATRNSIQGQTKTARYLEQSIAWGDDNIHIEEASPFSLTTIKVFCDCKFCQKETLNTGKCCTHIVGHLRRVLYLTHL